MLHSQAIDCAIT